MQAGRKKSARLHLTVLDAVRKGPAAVRDLPGELHTVPEPPADGARWAAMSEPASAAVEAWGAEAVETAKKAVENPDAIERLPEGVEQDYEAGIRLLEPMVDLGVPLSGLLTTVLQWHNGLQDSLYHMHEREELRKVVGRARRFADLLAPLCTPGKGYLPANKALGAHFVDRGLFVAGDTRTKRAMYEQALDWDPGNLNATRFLGELGG